MYLETCLLVIVLMYLQFVLKLDCELNLPACNCKHGKIYATRFVPQNVASVLHTADVGMSGFTKPRKGLRSKLYTVISMISVERGCHALTQWAHNDNRMTYLTNCDRMQISTTLTCAIVLIT